MTRNTKVILQASQKINRSIRFVNSFLSLHIVLLKYKFYYYLLTFVSIADLPVVCAGLLNEIISCEFRIPFKPVTCLAHINLLHLYDDYITSVTNVCLI